MSDTTKRNPLVGLLIAGAVLYVAHTNGIVDLSALKLPIPGKSAPAIDTTIPAPSAELQAVVASITAKLKEQPATAATYAGIYRAVANLIEAEPEKIKTTDDIRAVVVEAGDWATRNKIGTPGTAELIDGIAKAQLGDDPLPLDAAKRAKAIALYRAIAWACKEAT